MSSSGDDDDGGAVPLTEGDFAPHGSELPDGPFDPVEQSGLLHGEEDLPPFASQKARDINRRIHELEQEHDALEADVEANTGRTSTMREHVSAVHKELDQTRNIIAARQREADTEKHLAHLASREAAKVVAEGKKHKRECDEATDLAHSFQDQAFKLSAEVEALRSQLQVDEDELNEWVAVVKQKEEEFVRLDQYKRSDETKVKQLTKRLSDATALVRERQAALEKEITVTKSEQISLDKVSSEFEALHAERQQMLGRWEESLDVVQRRDARIRALEEKRIAANEEEASQRLVVQEQLRLVELFKAQNREMESKIDAADRDVAARRMDQQEAEEAAIQAHETVENIRGTVAKAATTRNDLRAQRDSLEADLAEQQKRVDRAKQKHGSVKAALEDKFRATDDEAERAKQLEQYVQYQEMQLASHEREHELLTQQVFKESTTRHELRSEYESLRAEKVGAQAQAKNLDGKIRKLDQESLKQQEIAYNQEYELQQLERRIARVEGQRTGAETQHLQNRIKELTTELESRQAEQHLLTQQHKKIEETFRHARGTLDKDNARQKQLEDQVHSLRTENDTAMRDVKKLIREKEQALVHENMMRLDVQRMRDILFLRADQVFDLEQRKIELRQAMDQRRADIAAQLVVLKAAVHTAEDDRRARAKELAALLQKIETLKAKYQVTLTRLQAITKDPDEDSGDVEPGERTQAYYIIKASQRKSELQAEAKNWGDKINAIKKEVGMIENSLHACNAVNARLHDVKTRGSAGLSRDGLTATGTRTQKRVATLEEQRTGLLRTRAQVKQAIEEAKNKSVQLSEQLEAQLQELQGAADTVEGIERDIVAQRQKLDRAKKALNRQISSKAGESSVARTAQAMAEREAKLLMLRERNHALLLECAAVVDSIPGAAAQVAATLASLGLQLPANSRPGSMANSRNGSATSRGRPSSHNSRLSTASSRVSGASVRGGARRTSASAVSPAPPPKSASGRPTSTTRAATKTPARRTPGATSRPGSVNRTGTPGRAGGGGSRLSTPAKLPRLTSASGASISREPPSSAFELSVDSRSSGKI